MWHVCSASFHNIDVPKSGFFFQNTFFWTAGSLFWRHKNGHFQEQKRTRPKTLDVIVEHVNVQIILSDFIFNLVFICDNNGITSTPKSYKRVYETECNIHINHFFGETWILQNSHNAAFNVILIQRSLVFGQLR